jgi:hypothetical protein
MTDIKNLPRAERRAAAAYLRQENAKWPEALKEWPRDEWPETYRNGSTIARIMRSRGFLVQVFHEPEPVTVRLSVLRTSIDTAGGWQQDITWEELQRIKREAGYGGHDAVEVFPPDVDVVNVANIRHLWVFDPGFLPFAWRRGGRS